VEVLEAAGFEVTIPKKPLCCGRPLYDFGMLDMAKSWLQEILESLRPEIAAGVSIVGLEPSCVSVFRDELPDLFPGDQDARRLSRQTFLLSEFLEKRAPDFPWPQLAGNALLHGHCHHKALMKLDAEESILKKIGVEDEAPDDGCCGMAGAFGFEQPHYDVSVTVGERALLPAVRAASKNTLIIADGFSCREQIAQTTDRRALHLAEVLRLALAQQPATSIRSYPERAFAPSPARIQARWRSMAAIGAGALLVGAAVAALKRAK